MQNYAGEPASGGGTDGAGVGTPSAASPAGTVAENEAVWLTAKRDGLRLAFAPMPVAGRGAVVVRTRAVALNPVDRLLPLIGNFFAPWLDYPFVPGSDVAGEVVAVGEAVARFRLGDRVLGHVAGMEKSRNRPAEGAFQRYAVLLERMAAPIPADMGFAEAAVQPLGLSTAAYGLFRGNQLALRPPAPGGGPTGEAVLIWGASTSAGSNAVQLARAAGYDVVATASPRNFAYVRDLGAGAVFDYRSPAAVGDVTRAVGSRRLAGALAIGAGSARACVAVVGACRGDCRVAMASPVVSFDAAPRGMRRTLWLVPTLSRMATASLAIRARRLGVRTSFVWGGALGDDVIGPLIYADYLPGALAEGRHVAAPPPLVAGSGLAAIPAALDRLGAGVSARTLVVTL